MKPGWLKRGLESAAREVKSWPKARRDMVRTDQEFTLHPNYEVLNIGEPTKLPIEVLMYPPKVSNKIEDRTTSQAILEVLSDRKARIMVKFFVDGVPVGGDQVIFSGSKFDAEDIFNGEKHLDEV
jgi:hypothetical protein